VAVTIFDLLSNGSQNLYETRQRVREHGLI
jgi:hypothetical protein